MLCAIPSHAEPKRGLHGMAELSLAEAFGHRSYAGPTLGGKSASYSDNFAGLTPGASLGAVWQPDAQWGFGLRGVAAWAPRTASAKPTIPGAPFGVFSFLGAEATGRLFFRQGIRPAFALSAGLLLATFGGGTDDLFAPGLVSNQQAFERLPGVTVAVSFEPRSLNWGPVTPFLSLRLARFWRSPAAATLVMPTLGAALYL